MQNAKKKNEKTKDKIWLFIFLCFFIYLCFYIFDILYIFLNLFIFSFVVTICSIGSVASFVRGSMRARTHHGCNAGPTTPPRAHSAFSPSIDRDGHNIWGPYIPKEITKVRQIRNLQIGKSHLHNKANFGAGGLEKWSLNKSKTVIQICVKWVFEICQTSHKSCIKPSKTI